LYRVFGRFSTRRPETTRGKKYKKHTSGNVNPGTLTSYISAAFRKQLSEESIRLTNGRKKLNFERFSASGGQKHLFKNFLQKQSEGEGGGRRGRGGGFYLVFPKFLGSYRVFGCFSA
jgi:hypothetical protein